MTLSTALVLMSLLPAVAAPERTTGGAFHAALDEPFAASWNAIPLRGLLRGIADNRRVAILLDRRIDPSQPITFTATDGSMRETLHGIAAHAGAEARIVGNVVCIGPPEPLAKLRTLAALRAQELRARLRSLPVSRQRQLTQGQTVHWNDLDRPADIVRQIAARFDLRIEGMDAIPHDLWAGATLPDLRADESLTLVLGQFDLTFEWTDDAEGVRIVPVPPHVALEKRYRPRGLTALAAAQRWRDEVPGIAADAQGGEVLVRGTAEQHDALDALLHPHPRPKSAPARPAPESLAKRLPSTARIQNVPASALIQKLEEGGVTFQYDAAALESAGIDLNRRISLNVKDAGPDEFLRALCEPLGLTYEIDGLTVRLSPGES